MCNMYANEVKKKEIGEGVGRLTLGNGAFFSEGVQAPLVDMDELSRLQGENARAEIQLAQLKRRGGHHHIARHTTGRGGTLGATKM